MSKIWDFFDNLNEYVYASDTESYELIYMNKKAMERYGFSAREEYLGRKCYEVIHGCSAPCAICNNNVLSEGHFSEWQYYNPKIDRHMLIKDTIVNDNGKRCRMEITVDITFHERKSNTLKSYQDLEELVNNGIHLSMSEPDPEKSINIILEYLGKALNGERTYIFEKNSLGGDDNTYEWVAAGVTPEKENLQNLPAGVCANWYRKFSEGKIILIEKLENIKKDDPLQYENLKRQNIRSVAVVPLYMNNTAIGFCGVDNPTTHCLEYAPTMLQIMEHYIVSTLKRRNLVRELKKMSFTDHLTNLGNRHAMENYIEQINRTSSIGIVYCDITGLKRVNDSKGHDAGDRLICSCCECLQKNLSEYGLFRIGGDELLAICPGINENTLAEKVSRLRKDIHDRSEEMAIGSVWHNEIKDLSFYISEAEKLMYHEKSEYYKSLGEN